MKAKRWTEDEIDFLVENFGKTSLRNMEIHLCRSKGSITNKAYKMGLQLKTNQTWFTLTDFCKSTSISRATVQYWIDHFEFPAKRKKSVTTKYLLIDPEDFWKWAAGNKHLIQWIDFPKYVFGDEPRWVEGARKASRHRINKRRMWSDRDIKELKYLLSKNKYTYPELAEHLHRSQGAIKRKIYDLGLPWPVYVNRKTVTPYTEEEIEQAAKLYSEGYPFFEIAKKIGRTESGLRGKLERSGYKFAGKRLERVD